MPDTAELREREEKLQGMGCSRRRKEDARYLRPSIGAICAVILLQIALGVATIVYEVPLRLALAHQANAILLFALALWHCHRSRAGLYQAAARA